MIAIIDYGMGNLRSVEKAFEFAGFAAKITANRADIRDASHLVLPGVGAIRDAVERLEKSGLDEVIRHEAQKGKPFLGICLGMQLLFQKSYENGEYPGLGLVEGEVVPFRTQGLRIPHMGWNNLDVKKDTLFSGSPFVYFVHSYHADKVPQEYISATAHYGYDFCAAVEKDNVFGTQFHPEKSGDIGIEIIKKFANLRG